jgi:uncharacterized FlaG/YvyC family protein
MQIYSDAASLMTLQAFAMPQGNQNIPAMTAVRDAVNAINQSELLGFDREMRFSTDPQSRQAFVQVLDRSSGRVIAQIPSQFILDLAQNLQTGN